MWRDFFWMHKPGGLAVFAISALVLAAAIAYKAFYILERREYLPAMQEFMRLGIYPLPQLVLSGLIAVETANLAQFC